MNAITLENIEMKFKERVLFENVTLEIEEGTINTIMGSSGSGKSTLLHIMGLLLKPTGGSVAVFDHQSVKPNSKEAMLLLRNEISYIFQNYALIDNATVYKNIELGLKYTKADRKKVIENMLQKVNLTHLKNEVVSTLSGGEQQRVAFARAFVKPGRIILCDEPTGNLDEKNKEIILELIKELNAAGKTVIIVTHDADIEKIAHHCFHIHDKKLVEDRNAFH